MGKKDISEKRLEDYADVFVDIVNVLAFHGERLLKEEDIVPGPTESVYDGEGSGSRSQFRDVLKYDMRGKTIISVIGLENQSDVDQDMIFRVMKYNAASYQSQIDRGEKYRRPVITLVLYFGSRRWSGPKTVMEALKVDDISYGKYAGELVLDGRINVYEIAFLPKEVREKFTSDFRIAADYFCAVREGREEEFRKDRRAFKHVKELLEFFQTFAGDRRFMAIGPKIVEKLKKGELINMYGIIDKAFLEGEAKGQIEGKKDLLTKLIQNLRSQGASDAQIEQVLSLPENQDFVRRLLKGSETKF